MKPEGPSESGVLLLDKPLGLSSNHALSRLKSLFSIKKMGHLGTLDPLATGMLVVAMGQATKFSSYGLVADKAYRFTLRLGEATDTLDSEGEVIERAGLPNLNQEIIVDVLNQFKGVSSQIPPIYSALKFEGKPLYAWVRQGRAIPDDVLKSKVREISISKIQLLSWRPNEIECEVSCSKGTYIRSLACDIAHALGTVGHVVALRRTSVAAFQETHMVCLSELEHASLSDRYARLLPMDSLVEHLPELSLKDSLLKKIHMGQTAPVTMADGCYRIYSESQAFHGLVHVSDGICSAKRLIHSVFNSSNKDKYIE